MSKYDDKTDDVAADTERNHKNDGPFVGDIFPFDAELYYRRGDDLFESRSNSQGDGKQKEETDELIIDPNIEVPLAPEIPIQAPLIPEIAAPPPVPTFSDEGKVNTILEKGYVLKLCYTILNLRHICLFYAVR